MKNISTTFHSNGWRGRCGPHTFFAGAFLLLCSAAPIELDEYAAQSVVNDADLFAQEVEDIANDHIEDFQTLGTESNGGVFTPYVDITDFDAYFDIEVGPWEYLEVLQDLSEEIVEDFEALDDSRREDLFEIVQHLSIETGADYDVVEPLVQDAFAQETPQYTAARDALLALRAELENARGIAEGFAPAGLFELLLDTGQVFQEPLQRATEARDAIDQLLAVYFP